MVLVDGRAVRPLPQSRPSWRNSLRCIRSAIARDARRHASRDLALLAFPSVPASESQAQLAEAPMLASSDGSQTSRIDITDARAVVAFWEVLLVNYASRWKCLLVAVALCAGGVSCSSNTSTGPKPGAGPMADSGGESSTAEPQEVKLQGSGATFPEPLYKKWFKAYNESHPNVIVDYQGKGSGAGIKEVTDKIVDFGASDAAMTPDEMAKVEGGVQLLPMTAGTIVLVYNLADVPDLKLSRDAYVGIFLGKIKKWNDPAIVASNEGVKLPDLDINVVVRADSSGTTFVFTKHLSAISAEFAASPGTNKMPNWPVGAKSAGNPGVSASIKSTPGSIGYVEYAFAKGAKLKSAKLQNKAGKFIETSTAAAQAALATAKFDDNLISWVPDPEADEAYPIVTYTWVIANKVYADPEKAKAFKNVLAFCLDKTQQATAETLGYIPLPDAVIEKDLAAVAQLGASPSSEASPAAAEPK